MKFSASEHQWHLTPIEAIEGGILFQPCLQKKKTIIFIATISGNYLFFPDGIT